MLFSFIPRQACPAGGLGIGIDGAEKLAFKAAGMAMDRQGAQRPGACPVPNPEKSQGFLTSFLGYNATGHEGLEGALRATETSCVPLQESTANRCAFFVYTRAGHGVSSNYS